TATSHTGLAPPSLPDALPISEGIPMRYSIRNGTARLGTAAAVLGLSLLACDRPRLFEPGRTEAARYAAARIVGSYAGTAVATVRSEEHTSELQSRENLVCRLL